MKPTQNAITLITGAEGFNGTPYPDTANIYTVGWGHALTTPDGHQIDIDKLGPVEALKLAHEAMQRMFGSQTITRAQGDALFLKDIGPRADALSAKVPQDTTQNQFDALLSFSYNTGLDGYTGSSVCKLHDAGKRSVGNLSLKDMCQKSKDHADPVNISIAFALWSKSNGVWTLGIFRRRMAELMVYSGWDAQKAHDAAWAFHD